MCVCMYDREREIEREGGWESGREEGTTYNNFFHYYDCLHRHDYRMRCCRDKHNKLTPIRRANRITITRRGLIIEHVHLGS